MNKARRQTHKKGTMKRLVNESLVLSATRFASSRVVRFFEIGVASPVLTSVKKVDDFARKNITGPLFEKTELRKNVTQPIRNLISLVFIRSKIFAKLCEARNALLNCSLRSIGVFFITFGLYSAAIFLAKHYMALSVGVADTSDLVCAAIALVIGLLLAIFGDKSVLSSIGTSRIVGTLLDACLGINESSLAVSKKAPVKTVASIGFLLGSIAGIFTLFYSPIRVIGGCAVVLVFVAVMNIPEFGLMSAVYTASFLPVEITLSLVIVSIVSFVLKCLRLKRNFRFGSADALVLVLFALITLSCSATEGGISRGESYLLSFFAMYFLAKNLVCSERLLYQTFNSLTSGLRVGMALYILGEYAMYISHPHLRSAAFWISDNVLSPEMLVIMAVATLPFSFSLCVEGGRKRRELRTMLLVLACAILVDSFAFYAMALVSLFVYIMLAYKAPAGALLGGAIVLSPAFAVISKIVTPFSAFDKNSSYDVILGADSVEAASNYWSAFTDVCGVLCTAVFGIAMIFVIYRVFGCMAVNRTPKVSQSCGTVVASAIMMLTCSFIFNPFSDLRVLAVMWFVLGLCGSVYTVYTKSQYSE